MPLIYTILQSCQEVFPYYASPPDKNIQGQAPTLSQRERERREGDLLKENQKENLY